MSSGLFGLFRGGRLSFGRVAGPLAFACACEPDLPPSGVVPTPNGPCSDLTRAAARYQGIEYQVCGAEGLPYRTLSPVGGDGHLLTWTPMTGQRELWRLTDAPEGVEPLSTGIWRSYIGWGRQMLPAGPHNVYEYTAVDQVMRLFKFTSDVRGGDDPTPSFVVMSMADGLDLHDIKSRVLVSLDMDHLLDVEPGSGRYRVLERRNSSTLSGYPYSEPKPFLKRGFRLVGLGEGRLLAWAPGRASELGPTPSTYEIWPYDLENLPEEVFAPEAVASGVLDGIGVQNELLVVAPGRLVVWDRDAGTIEQRTFEDLAESPLAGEVLRRSQDDRFRSRRPDWEPPTTSKTVHRLVAIVQDGRSFDSYFGQYCRAKPGSEPACENGRDCCEGAVGSPGTELEFAL